MESAHTGAFNVQAFLDSGGIARTIVGYRRAEVIFTQGDPGESVLYIQNGGVTLSVLSKTGKEAIIAMLGPGDFFGEGCRRVEEVAMGGRCSLALSAVSGFVRV
jgi:CRP/FNR family transcriptional regulator, cyclic AMP receptor protein